MRINGIIILIMFFLTVLSFINGYAQDRITVPGNTKMPVYYVSASGITEGQAR